MSYSPSNCFNIINQISCVKNLYFKTKNKVKISACLISQTNIICTPTEYIFFQGVEECTYVWFTCNVYIKYEYTVCMCSKKIFISSIGIPNCKYINTATKNSPYIKSKILQRYKTVIYSLFFHRANQSNVKGAYINYDCRTEHDFYRPRIGCINNGIFENFKTLKGAKHAH